MLSQKRNIHFIGIGGIGMSGIAWLCMKEGHRVSGSDIKPTRITQKLLQQGARICIGHKRNNLQDADLVVYSTAISSQNPELKTAQDKRMQTFHRGEFLAYLMKEKTGIAVTGAHGKTTTSSLIATMLYKLGYDPTAMIGALVSSFNGNAFLGKSEYFVAEADESDGSFLYIEPSYSVITNIDVEHMDYYSNMDAVRAAFRKFVENTKGDGTVICCGDDANIRRVISGTKKRIITYGSLKRNILHADRIRFDGAKTNFRCIYKKTPLGNVELNLPGEHNALNALAAISLGLDIGIEFNKISACLKDYKGAERRFQIRDKINDILIIDDYAHHPTEIKATLKGCRHFNPERIIAVFQPHRYTRTKYLKKEFARAFTDADIVILTDIYPASEQPIYGVTSMIIYEELLRIQKRNVTYLPKDRIIQQLLSISRPGDIVIILGAGDIYKLADEFVDRVLTKMEDAIAQKG